MAEVALGRLGWTLFIAFAAAAVTGAGVFSAQRRGAPPNAAAEARRLEQEGRHGDAARLFETAALQEPGRAQFHLDAAGRNHLDARQFRDALRVFGRLHAERPSLGNARDGLSIARFETGDLTGLLDLLSKRLSPADDKEAARIVRAGIAAPAGSVEREWALAWLYTRFGRYNPRAVPHLRAVLEQQPEHEQARWRLAQALRAGGKPDEARQVAAEYLKRHPDAPEAVVLRAQAILDSCDGCGPGRTLEVGGRKLSDKERALAEKVRLQALEELQAGIRRFPEARFLYGHALTLCERSPEPKAGLAAMRELLKAAQGSKEPAAGMLVQARLAAFAALHGRYEEAERLYGEMAEKSSRPVFAEPLALLKAARGRFGEAADALSAAARALEGDGFAPPERVSGLRELQFLSLLAAGKKADAVALAAAAEARRALASAELEAFRYWLRSANGRLAGPAYREGEEVSLRVSWQPDRRTAGLRLQEAARQAALRAIARQYPSCYPAHFALARSLALSGKTEEGLQSLRAARSSGARWWAPHWALAEYYLRFGPREAARKPLERVRSLAPRFEAARRMLASFASRPAPARSGTGRQPRR